MKLDKFSFAKLIGFIERSHALNLSKSQIESIDDIIDIEMPEQEKIYPKTSDIEYLLAAIKYGRKIEAIKGYRNLTGMGLKESKDMIEKYWNNAPYVKGSFEVLRANI